MRVLMVAAALVCTAFSSVPAYAEADVAFSYTGRVKVQGQPFSGTGHFKFAVVNTSGSATLWSNDGTGLNGGEPTASISLPVEEGIFNVVVGDTSLGMQPINATIFNTQTPPKLRVWFNDGVQGFQQLNPDQTLVNLTLNILQTGRSDFTIYVNGATGNDANNGLTPATAKKTIQGGVDALPERVRCNVTIDVAAGTYRESVSLVGLTVMPQKKLRIIGDKTWTPGQGGNPSVVINGYASGTSGNKVLVHGVTAVSCANVELQGLYVTGMSDRGMSLENGTYWVKNCKAEGCGSQGFLGNRNCYVEFASCVADGQVEQSFGVAEVSKAVLTNCSASNNGTVGLGLYNGSSAQITGTNVFASNKGKQVNLANQGAIAVWANSVVQLSNANASSAYGIYCGWGSRIYDFEKFTFTGNLHTNLERYVDSQAFFGDGSVVPLPPAGGGDGE